MNTLTRVRAVVVAAQVRILPVIGGVIFRRLDTKSSTTMRTDRQALQQVNPGRLLSGFGNNPPAGTYRLAKLPEVFTDDRLLFAF